MRNKVTASGLLNTTADKYLEEEPDCLKSTLIFYFDSSVVKHT